MFGLDWKFLQPYIAGFISAIMLGIIANLITPDRAWLLNQLRSIWSTRSVQAAEKEKVRIKDRLDHVELLRANPEKMVRFLGRELFVLLMMLCMIGLVAALGTLDPGSRALQGGFMLGGFFTCFTTTVQTIRVINRVDRISEYQEKVGENEQA